MALIVQKYGGKVVSTKEQLEIIARRLIQLYEEGNKLIVVTSAPADMTDQLISTAQQLANSPNRRELDSLLATGERHTATALAIVINHIAGKDIAQSFTGSQAGIITDDNHGSAKIVEVRGNRIRRTLENGKIVVVAGFQGYSPSSDAITTLGRGGSDQTAVALAAALEANRCELYKDVDGIYTADPHQVEDARLLQVLDYDEALSLSKAGMKAIQTNAIEMARNKRIPIVIMSAETAKIGTIINKQEVSHCTVTALTSQSKMVMFKLQNDFLENLIKMQGFPNSIYMDKQLSWVVAPMDEKSNLSVSFHSEGIGCDKITAVGSGLFPGSPAIRELMIELREFKNDLMITFVNVGTFESYVSDGIGKDIIKKWHHLCATNGWLPSRNKRVSLR